MGYQALLFCPEEKTARTVTQVLSDLEFAVEACSEPFAAVKKLMGQHFDAVVVDCDNEQNATLLLKSARNSSSNQTSLAVAVVEGQAGVAKAFRIGANLVLTKPINIEQAKGTLRVARGLLRKSEPAKAVAPGAAGGQTSGTAPAKAAANKPISTPQTAAPPVLASPPPAAIPPAKPLTTPAWPVAATAISKAIEQDDDLLEIDVEKSTKTSAVSAPIASASDIDASVLPEEILPAPRIASEARPTFVTTSKATSGSGAASAPAPARETKDPRVTGKSPAATTADVLFDKPTPAASGESAGVIGSAPSFTFGGSSVEVESSGGNKKIFLGVAAAAIVAVGLYAGWAHFHASAEHGFADQPATTQPASTTAPVAPPLAAKPSSAASSPATTSATPTPTGTPAKSKVQSAFEAALEGDDSPSPTNSAKPLSTTSSTSGKTAAPAKAEATPLVVKGGKVPASRTKTADAPAPSLIGMASPGAAAPPPNLVSVGNNAFKPVLQTVNVSQGVSQGLLFKKVSPSYPANALRLRIEGTVELLATISKTGDIAYIKVLSGDSQLTKAATDAVKQWKYKPYLLNGEPVEIQTQITVNFRLPH